MVERLTGQVGHGLEFLLPELGDLDGLLMGIDAVGGHPLLVGMLHDLCQIFRMEGVQDVEEILPGWALAPREPIREEHHELLVRLEIREELLDRELVIMRDADGVDVGLLHQHILAHQDVFQEILCYDRVLRQMILD